MNISANSLDINSGTMSIDSNTLYLSSSRMYWQSGSVYAQNSSGSTAAASTGSWLLDTPWSVSEGVRMYFYNGLLVEAYLTES